MKLKEFKEFVKKVYLKHEEFTRPIPILAVGSTATAKSSAIAQLGLELKVPVIQLRTALMEPSDITGIPRPQDGYTYWLKPCFWPLDKEEWTKIKGETPAETGELIVNGIKKYGPKGILFLDEVNRGMLETIQAIFQLLTDQKIHTHELPSGYQIVGAINPGELYATTEIDDAFWTRWLQIRVEPEPEEVLSYFGEVNMPMEMIDVLAAMPNLLHKTENFDLNVRPSARGWEMVGNLIRTGIINPIKLEDMEIIQGAVGLEAAAGIKTFYGKKYEKPISGKDVLENWKNVKDQVQNQVNDIENKLDKVVATCRGVIAYHTQLNATDRYVENLIEFLKILPEEQQMYVLKHLKNTFLEKVIKIGGPVVDRLIKILEELNK